MDLTSEEAVVLQLLEAMSANGNVVGKDKRLALSKLVFLVAHGVFDDHGRIVGLRQFPRIDVDFRIYFRGVHSRDVYEVLERLEEKGLIKIEKDGTIVLEKNRINEIPEYTTALSREVGQVLEHVKKLTVLSPRELEELTNRLLGIRSEEAKVIVFNTKVTRLVAAREEAKKLEEQGKLVDI